MRLFARDDELGSLRGALEQAAEGRRAAVLVEGEAGIGKSALVQEVLRDSTPGVSHLFYGAADRLGGGLPFGLLASALGVTPQLHDGPLAEVAHILFRSDGETGALRFRAIETSLNALEELAEDRPVVLVLEDLHWADEATLALIERFLRRSEFVRICLIVTARRTLALRSWQP